MVDAILGIIGTLLYPLFSIIFLLIDGLVDIFRSFAGTGEIRFGNSLGFGVNISAGNTGEQADTGILYYLLQTDIVKNMLISILLLGLFLLIIFTVMAFIKNAYSAKPKTWQEIIANAFKGLANFVFVPVCCLLGVWLGNILLNAIDGATSQNGSTSMAGKLFVAAAYNANWVRQSYCEGYIDEDTVVDLNSDSYKDWVSKVKDRCEDRDIDFDETKAKEDPEYLANKVDETFQVGYEQGGGMAILSYITVGGYYQLFSINYLVIVVGGLFICYVMASLAYAMIRRLFIILMLFIVSPGLCAMYPLDEGKAVGSWKGDFIKQVISAYGAVAGMNIFLAILPLLQSVKLPLGPGEILNQLGMTELILLICGLLVVKEFISMISNYIGAENAYDKGVSMRKSVKEAGKKFGKPVVSGNFKAIGKAWAAHKDGKSGVGAYLASLATQTRDGINKSLDITDTVKDLKDALKAGGDEYKRQKDVTRLENLQQRYTEIPEGAEGDEQRKFIQNQIKSQLAKLGILDEVEGKIAKENGLSLEDHRSNVESLKKFNTAVSDQDKAHKSLEDLEGLLKKFASGTATAEDNEKLKLARIDMDHLMSISGASSDWIAEQLLNGIRFDGEAVNPDIVGIDVANARLELTKASDVRLDLKKSVTDLEKAATTALDDMAKAWKESADSSMQTFSKDAVEEIKKSMQTAFVNGTKFELKNIDTTPGGEYKDSPELRKSLENLQQVTDKFANTNKDIVNKLDDMSKGIVKGLGSELSKALKKAEEKDKK